MIKRLTIWGIVVAFLSVMIEPAIYAQTTLPGASGTSTATVTPVLEFSINKVVKMRTGIDSDPWTQGTPQTTPDFNFGTLQKLLDASGNLLYMQGQFFYYVLMLPSTSGRRYKITESGTQLSGTGGAININSVLLIPDYQGADLFKFGTSSAPQGTMPSGAFLGPATTACASNSLVYQSDNAGLGRIVRAIVAITGPPLGATAPFNWSRGFDQNGLAQGSQQPFTQWQPITTDQAAGTFTGTITFTLTLN